MRDSDIITTELELTAALGLVSVSGQLAWGWTWAIEESLSQDDTSEPAELMGWLVQVAFWRPDRDGGNEGLGFGRWLFVRRNATAREVWGTAFTAIKLILEHELLEAFKVDGRRVFDPHCPMIPEVSP